VGNSIAGLLPLEGGEKQEGVIQLLNPSNKDKNRNIVDDVLFNIRKACKGDYKK